MKVRYNKKNHIIWEQVGDMVTVHCEGGRLKYFIDTADMSKATVDNIRRTIFRHELKDVIAMFEWLNSYADEIDGALYHLNNHQFFNACGDMTTYIDNLLSLNTFGNLHPVIKNTLDYDEIERELIEGDVVYDYEGHEREGFYFVTSEGVFGIYL